MSKMDGDAAYAAKLQQQEYAQAIPVAEPAVPVAQPVLYADASRSRSGRQYFRPRPAVLIVEYPSCPPGAPPGGIWVEVRGWPASNRLALLITAGPLFVVCRPVTLVHRLVLAAASGRCCSGP